MIGNAKRHIIMMRRVLYMRILFQKHGTLVITLLLKIGTNY